MTTTLDTNNTPGFFGGKPPVPFPTSATAVPSYTARRPASPRAGIISAIVDLLEYMIRQNDAKHALFSRAIPRGCPASYFSAVNLHNTVPLRRYAEYLAEKLPFSDSVFVVALVYIIRLQTCKGATIFVNSYTVHRLLLTALVVASKYMEDIVLLNADFAKLGGLRCFKDLNAMESVFLNEMKFELFVEPALYDDTLEMLTNA